MFDCAYLVENLTPKRIDSPDPKDKMGLFAERYCRIFDLRLGVSVPDNPMGQPRFSLLEMIEQANLPAKPEKTVMNLNTFHAKEELDGLLKKAAKMGVKYLLVIRGDGGPKLPKLNPESIGGDKTVATSIDLLRYINTEYAEKFITGCAYNHYNPMPFESNRLREKMDAGAKFVITQPVIGKNPNIDAIFEFGIPVVIEAWMSKNLELLFKSVRKEKDEKIKDYDPLKNLRTLHEAYPDCCIYLSMLGFRKQWSEILPKL
jgi:methylenetetrahydrofolate reductase (NADPH)